jgi:hypothetical protein
MRALSILCVFLLACGARTAPLEAGCEMPELDASDADVVDAANEATADSNADAPLACPELGKPCQPPGTVVCKDSSHAFVCECFASGCAWTSRSGINCLAPFCSP